MAKEKFIMVSLEDNQAKQLAEVLNNDTSRKIINYLSEHEDVTEAQLAKELGIPLPTVHYNMQKLKEAQLVGVEEFHYSKKGREVDHYKLANKYVIITPKPVKGIKTQLRHILPAIGAVAGISGLIYLLKNYFLPNTAQVAESVKSIAVQETADTASFALKAAAPEAAVQASQTAVQTAQSEPNIALWFLLGGISALVVYLIISLLRREK